MQAGRRDCRFIAPHFLALRDEPARFKRNACRVTVQTFLSKCLFVVCLSTQHLLGLRIPSDTVCWCLVTGAAWSAELPQESDLFCGHVDRIATFVVIYWGEDRPGPFLNSAEQLTQCESTIARGKR